MDYACFNCADTGIIRASLVKAKNESGLDYNEKVNVVICSEHDTSVSEKMIETISEASSLPVDIVGVEHPIDNQSS